MLYKKKIRFSPNDDYGFVREARMKSLRVGSKRTMKPFGLKKTPTIRPRTIRIIKR